MHSIRIAWTVCVLVALGWSSTVFAERGRYSDGRAYRIDRDGNELADYTAELEVQLDAMRLRVRTLENELQESRRGSQRDLPSTDRVSERDLLADAPSPRLFEEQTGGVAALSEAEARVASLQRELQACHFARQSEVESGQSCNEELRRVQTQVQRARSAQEAHVTLSSEREQLAAELSTAERELSQLRAEKRDTSRRERELELRIREVDAERQREIEQRKQVELQLAALREQQQASDVAAQNQDRASLRTISQQARSVPPVRRGSVVSAGVHGQSEEGIREQLRAELLEKLRVLEPDVVRRDQLFERFNARTGALKLSPRATRSSFDLYGRQIPRSNFAQLRAYARDMERFEQGLREDLQTVERLGRAQ